MKTILVTGSTGFLGSHLVMQLLGRGYTVVAMKRQTSAMQLFDSVKNQYLNPVPEPTKERFLQKKVELFFAEMQDGLENRLHWVTGDITDIDTLLEAFVFNGKPVDAIFNCAALVSFSPKDKERLIDFNVQGTANVVNACLKLQIPVLMHTSSVAALGRKEDSDIFTEDSEWVESKYNTRYALSKYLSELEVWRGKEEGLTVGVVNPGIILGFGDGPTASKQLYDIVKSPNPFLPMGSNGFIWIDQLASMMIDMFENQRFGQRYLGVTHNLSYAELFQAIADELGVKAPSLKLQGFVYRLGLAILSFGSIMGVSKELLVSTSKRCVYESVR